MRRGDLVRVRQTWGLYHNKLGIVVDCWDETPITPEYGETVHKKIGCQVWLFDCPEIPEEFYDYQLEIVSEGRYEKRGD